MESPEHAQSGVFEGKRGDDASAPSVSLNESFSDHIETLLDAAKQKSEEFVPADISALEGSVGLKDRSVQEGIRNEMRIPERKDGLLARVKTAYDALVGTLENMRARAAGSVVRGGKTAMIAAMTLGGIQASAQEPVRMEASQAKPDSLGNAADTSDASAASPIDVEQRYGEIASTEIAGLRQNIQAQKEVLDNSNTKILMDKMRMGLISDKNIQKSAAEDLAKDKDDSIFANLSLVQSEQNVKNLSENLNDSSVMGDINASRDWMVKHFESPEYLNKLVEGEHMNIDSARAEQQARIDAVNNVPVYVDMSDLGESVTEFDSTTGNPKDIIYSAGQIAQNPKEVTIHEMEHVATDAEFAMTPEAQRLYAEALRPREEFDTLVYTPLGQIAGLSDDTASDHQLNNFEYLTHPSEMDARKKTLEKAMEDLGIKKPFDTMTHEHYQKIRKLMEEGKLNYSIMQLILITTEDGLIDILNNVAASGKAKEKPGAFEPAETEMVA